MFYRKAHRKAMESQKKHQKEVEQLEQELKEVQQAMSQFEQEGDSQGDDLQLVDSQVRMCKLECIHTYVRMLHLKKLLSFWDKQSQVFVSINTSSL